MSNTEVLEGEVVSIVPAQPRNLFAATSGQAVVSQATERADALAEVVKKKQLFTKIGGKEHVRVEGWTLLGSMMGVFPVTDWVKELHDDGKLVGFEARVEARTLEGAVVGAAVARCTRSEANWKSRDDYALESMAQTRATSKALRQPLGFIMQLAGFEATPAEEIPVEGEEAPAPGRAAPQPSTDPEEIPPKEEQTRLRRRMFAIGKEMGLAQDDLKPLLLGRFGVKSSTELKRGQWADFFAFLDELKDLGAEKVTELVTSAKADLATGA